jgi:fructokinase
MNHAEIWVLGEALMDCMAQPDGSLHPLLGGSPFNLARACALRGAKVGYLNPLSHDVFGQQLAAQLQHDGVHTLSPQTALPTSLAVVQLHQGQPSYGFYREGIADRAYTVEHITTLLDQHAPGVLHTGSLMLLPPEHTKVMHVLQHARERGWTISIDVNLRPKLATDLDAYVQAVQAVIPLAHWLKASDEDLALLGFANPQRKHAARIAPHFTQQGVQRLALTFGAEGAWLWVDGVIAEHAVPAVTVADTVGAGDTFWGNCLGDWVQHPHDALARVPTTLQEAMCAAAINCTRTGCQPPTYAEVQAALQP